MTTELANQNFQEVTKRIETDRSGPFVFQIGPATHEIRGAMIRVDDAHARFVNSPLSQVENQLEQQDRGRDVRVHKQ